MIKLLLENEQTGEVFEAFGYIHLDNNERYLIGNDINDGLNKVFNLDTCKEDTLDIEYSQWIVKGYFTDNPDTLDIDPPDGWEWGSH